MHEYDKATAFTLRYGAFDQINQVWIQEDAAALHSLILVRDGSPSNPINVPGQTAGVVGLNIGPLTHTLAVTDAESDCDDLELWGTSSTEGVIIIPWVGQASRLPSVELGQPNGLPILDADGDWLTAGQQSQLDAVEEGVGSLGTGQPVTINPVGAGGKITLYAGFDYTADTTPIVIPDSSPASLPVIGTSLVLLCVEDVYGDGGVEFELSGEVTVEGAMVTGTGVELGAPGNYRWLLHHVVNGTLHKLDLAGQMIIRKGR